MKTTNMIVMRHTQTHRQIHIIQPKKVQDKKTQNMIRKEQQEASECARAFALLPAIKR